MASDYLQDKGKIIHRLIPQHPAPAYPITHFTKNFTFKPSSTSFCTCLRTRLPPRPGLLHLPFLLPGICFPVSLPFSSSQPQLIFFFNISKAYDQQCFGLTATILDVNLKQNSFYCILTTHSFLHLLLECSP